MFKKSFVLYRNGIPYTFETPFCILHTRTGCIPHLTSETFGYINPKLISNCYQLPISTVIDFSDTIKSSLKTAAECFSLPNQSLLFTSITDASRPTISGYNTKTSVAFWKIGGKVSISSQMYMNNIEAIQPDVFEILSDGDVQKTDSRKRVLKSITRSLKFLEDCVNYQRKSETLKDKNFMCMIEGGYLIEERKHFVNLLLNKLEELQAEPWGYVFDLIASEEIIDLKTIEMIKETVNLLPEDKPVAMYGFGHPLTIILLVLSGISMFDASYVTKISEENYALIYKIPSLKNIDFDINHLTQISNFDKFRDKINLKDTCHAKAFIPLLENCDCYTCTHHTRAYLHHLIETKEMLATVLLMLHNLHHFFTFFKSLQSLKSDKELISFYNSIVQSNYQ